MSASAVGRLCVVVMAVSASPILSQSQRLARVGRAGLAGSASHVFVWFGWSAARAGSPERTAELLRGFERRAVVGIQRDVDRGEVLFEVLDGGRPRNQQHSLVAIEQPCERDLRDARAVFFADLGDRRVLSKLGRATRERRAEREVRNE